jgi:anti-sigma B factor antagonist
VETTRGPHAGALSVSVAHPGSGAPVLSLSGELDMATSTVLSERLTELVRGGTDVVVDLSNLRFIDSSGLSALLAALRQSQAGRTTLWLRRPTTTVARVLAITGLDRVFAVEP